MEIKDYSTRLAQARDNFKRDVGRLKDSHQLELKQKEENHRDVEKKHLKANTQKLAEISEDSKATIDKIDRKLAKKMKQSTDDYRRNLERNQTQFNNDRSTIKKKFDDKLSYLRDNYSQSKNSLERSFNQQVGDINERAQNTRDFQAKEYDNSVKDISNTYSDKFDKYREKEDYEKKVLIRSHDSDLQNIAKKEAAVRNKAAIRHQEDMNILRKVANEERRQMKDNQSQQIKEIKSNQELENKILNRNFTDLTNDITLRNDKNRKTASRSTKELLKRKDRDFAKDVYQLKRELNEKLNGGDAEQRLDNRVERTEDSYKKRIDTIQEGIEDARFKNAADKERLNDENLNLMRNTKIKQRTEVEKLKKGFEDIHAKNASENKKDITFMVKNYRNELNKTVRNAEQQGINSRVKTKNLLNNQRRTFHDTITKLNEKNLEAVTSIKNETTKEKSQMIEDYKVRLHNETEDIKGDLRASFERKEESWDKRLNDQKLVLEKIKEQYEAKIERLNKKNAKELVVMRELQEQRDIEEKRDIKRAFNDKEREHAFEKKLLKGQYEKRLSDSKNTFDENINKLVERYENRIVRERKELTNDMQRKLTAARADYDRLYKQSENEKANMRFQFETRMDKTRQANDQTVKRLASSRRIEQS